ncbi:MAG: helicase [Parachlamydiales bacterium]|nr:helicase [Parachlamydiales bacterium]
MEKSVLESGLNNIDTSSFHRGKKYAREKRVVVVSRTPTQIEARVSGSAETPYCVKIWREGTSLRGTCSCPIGSKCKHIAATLLHGLQGVNKQVNLPAQASLSQEPLLSYDEKSWIESITAVSPPPPLPASTSGLFYILDYFPVFRGYPHLQIKCHVARRKKSGELSEAAGKVFDAADLFQSSLPQLLKNACQEADWELLHLLWEKATIHRAGETVLLQKMIATQRCVWKTVGAPPIRWGSDKNGSLSWDLRNQLHGLSLTADMDNALCFLLNDGGIYIDPSTHNCGILLLPEKPEVVARLLSAPSIDPQKISWIQKKIENLLPHVPVRKKKIVTLSSQKPVPCLTLRERKDSWGTCIVNGDLSFLYGSYTLPALLNPPPSSSLQKDDTIYNIPRTPSLEIQAIQTLRAQRWFGYGLDFQQTLPQDDLCFLLQLMQTLKEAGWLIEVPKSFPIQSIVKADQDWYVEVDDAKNKWFDLEIGQLINGKRVNLIPYLRKFLSSLPDNNPNFDRLAPEELQKQVAIPIDNGEFLLISIDKLKSILEPFLGLLNPTSKESKLRLHDWQVGTLSQLKEALPSGRLEWQSSERFALMAEELKNVNKVETATPPKGLQAELRHYQIIGLSWLQFLRRFNLAGILADDMGLGKTVQTLAHILLEKEEGRLTHPVLVVAPTTLMGNWSMEAKKFTPSLKVLVLHGNDRKKHFDDLLSYDLILTTYPLLSRDQETLTRHQYHILILDEAQNIKNAKTQAHLVLRELKASTRLCLTGTPMENHLGELWSLFTLLLPGFLGDEKQFYKLFRKPIEKEGSLTRKKILQKRIAPFLLRRTKQEVIQELPPKTEMITRIELTEKQQELYEAVRLTMMNKVMAEVEAKGLARSRIILLDALLKLRQICCDPRLLKTASGCSIAHSAKLLHFKEIIPQMVENKRRILLFSQFTSMLSLMEELLHELSIPYVTITGDTKDRMTPVQRFQSEEVPLFLISLKAGGTGLNLTAADTVIHYDPWWNPAVENQATDRAHRIGQTKPVFVYKWIAEGSVEEKILQLQVKKKKLADSLFDASSTASLDLNLEDLQSLFAPLS